MTERQRWAKISVICEFSKYDKMENTIHGEKKLRLV
jgi:hypothetical protein